MQSVFGCEEQMPQAKVKKIKFTLQPAMEETE
jgi:hypothetical protein